MPEWRKDPIVDRWVIIAKNRAERPMELVDRPAPRAPGGSCPFCEGNEHETPHEIACLRSPASGRDAPGWRIRVVPNRYPALLFDGSPSSPPGGMGQTLEGIGAHEVIIESPRHVVSVSELSDDELAELFWIYRERLIDLRQDERLVYGLIFKNVGAAAGASIEHTHSQLIATPIVPTGVAEELSGALGYYRSHGTCVFCRMIAEERELGERVVVDADEYLAFCPFAPRFPFETWIVPKHHASQYETLSRPAAAELGFVVKRVIGKIETALDHPAYNYIIHTAPFDTPASGHYHWHIEIIPRVTKTAGFEWGTGCYINPVPPEEAATVMRGL